MKLSKLVFLIVVLVNMYGTTVSAYDAKIDGIYYNLIDSRAEVTYKERIDQYNMYGYGYTAYKSDYAGKIIIPESVNYNGTIYSVTSIGDNAFNDCDGLTSIEIPNSITSIGVDAFKGTAWFNDQTDGIVYAGKIAYKYKGEMLANSKIELKEGTLGIASGAFSLCSNMTSITIPNSVKCIGQSAFKGCSGLLSIIIPNSVTYIDYGAFSECYGLTSVTIGNSVTSIGELAFIDCKNLTTITIPNSVTSIGTAAFERCSSLISVVLGNNLTSIAPSTFRDCNNLSSINIPNSVINIEAAAFYGCSGLTSVSIPNSVTSIGNHAFYGCKRLTSIIIPNSVMSIGVQVFSGCNDLTSVSYLCSPTSIGKDIFKDCDNIKEVTLDSDKVPSNIFSGKEFIEKVYFSEKVTSIGSMAFNYCRRLTSITLPNSVASLESEAFSRCYSLKSITIPSSLNDIGDQPFSQCYCVENFNITVTDYSDFCNNNLLRKVKYFFKDWLNPNPRSTNITLLDKDGNEIKEYKIPDGVTSINDYAFYYCVGLTSVSIPNSVTSIGTCAFAGCNSLNSITIPPNVISIGNGAFHVPLNTVVSLIEEPFKIHTLTPNIIYYNLSEEDEGVFSISNYYDATLYVPKGTIDKYKATEGWKDFAHIEENNGETGILSIVSENETNTIYSIKGNSLQCPSKGINIIKMKNGTAKKVLIK